MAMKKGEYGSDTPPKDNESSSDPKFEKRTFLILKQIKDKEKDGEITANELNLLESTINNTSFLKSEGIKGSGQMIAERTSDPKFEKRTFLILKQIKDKEKDGEITANELNLLKSNL